MPIFFAALLGLGHFAGLTRHIADQDGLYSINEIPLYISPDSKARNALHFVKNSHVNRKNADAILNVSINYFVQMKTLNFNGIDVGFGSGTKCHRVFKHKRRVSEVSESVGKFMSDSYPKIFSGRRTNVFDDGHDPNMIYRLVGIDLNVNCMTTEYYPSAGRNLKTGFCGVCGAMSSNGVALGYLKRPSLFDIGFSGLPARAFLEQEIKAIATSGFAQSAVRLDDSNDQADNGGQGKSRADDRRYVCRAGFRRCFFASEGGPPLGAQVGGIVALCFIAGVGVAIGIGPVGRLRRFGWRGSKLGRGLCLLAALGSISFFGWLLSAAYS